MSRIGKKPISTPKGVTVQVSNSRVDVKGPMGALVRNVNEAISVKVEGQEIRVMPKVEGSEGFSALQGLTRTLLANMIEGVVKPWKKELEIQGVGYRAFKNGQVLNLQLGFSHPIDFKIPDIVQFAVDPKQTLISLSSPDKEVLGNVAAKIRSLRPPEPYKGKGIRYVGEHILRKAGKAAGAVGSGAAGKK